MTFFGLAKLCNERHLRSNELSYLSPKLKEQFQEQIEDLFDSKDDVYALGIVLGKMLLKNHDEEVI